MKRGLKAADMEKQLLRDKLAELTLENMRLGKQMQNSAFLQRRLDAAMAERDEYKRRALKAESALRRITKEAMNI